MTSSLTLGLDSLAALATLLVLGRYLFLSLRPYFNLEAGVQNIFGLASEKRSLLDQHVRRRVA